MGRKSSKKKNRFQTRALRDDGSNNKLENIINWNVLSGIFLFIWGLSLFDKTFISYRTQIIIILIGAVVGILAFHFLLRQKKYGLFVTIFYGFFLGAPVPYGIIATTNYYLRQNNSENVLLEFLKTGNGSGRRKKCKTPFAGIFKNG
jgi:uncharacterized membrane protein YeaQ/YmgE (transglycosylase-associated protein family)